MNATSNTTRDAGDTLRIEVRFKNARLYNAMMSLAPAHATRRPSVSSFCRRYGFSQVVVGRLLMLKDKPVGCHRHVGCARVLFIRPICQELAALTGHDVSWLFPSDLYACAWPLVAVETSHVSFIPLLGAPREYLTLQASQDEVIEEQDRASVISRALLKLTPRAAEIIRRRYGLAGYDEHTLSELGKEFGMSLMQVRLIEAKALRTLRRSTTARLLKSCLTTH